MIHQIKPEAFEQFISQRAFKPGDTLQLEAGGVYPGFRLEEVRGLDITAPAEGALIQGGEGHGLVLEGCEDITVSNLRFVGAGRKYHNRQGVGLLVLGGRGITVQDCTASGFQRGGFEARGVSQLRFERLKAHDNGYAGIHVTQGEQGGWSQDVTITHCSAVNNPGDPQVTANHSGNGIVLYYTRDALVEYCDASYNGWDMNNSRFNGPVGIWCANTHRAVFRYCLSHDNRTQWSKTDGGGFDFDGGTRDCLIEYCYSYDNAGAGYMFCQYVNAAELSGNTIRYSTSFNDGSAYHKSALYLYDCGSQSLAEGGQFYRNLLYNSDGRDLVRGHIDATFIRENLMLLSGEGKFFRHETDDDNLQYRGPERQQWGKVVYENNREVHLEGQHVESSLRQLADYPRIQSAQELPAYFEQLGLEDLELG